MGLAFELAGRIGNQAMLELLARTGGGLGHPVPAFPDTAPAAEAAQWDVGDAAPDAAAPDFSALGAL